MILNFNRDLYLHDNEKTILIDINVTDIDNSTYIKENKWYVNNGLGKNYGFQLILEAKDPFIFINNEECMFASTLRTIYRYGGVGDRANIIEKTFNKDIIKIATYTRNRIDILIDNTTGSYDYMLGCQLCNYPVEDIGNYLIKMKKDGYYLNAYAGQYNLTKYKLNDIKSCVCFDDIYILTNESLFKENHSVSNGLMFNKIVKSDKIKRISGNQYGLYEIR